MGIAFRKDRNKWELSIYSNGERKRFSFETKAEAEEKQRQLEGVSVVRGDIKGLIHKYFELFSKRKTSASEERRYFEELYDFLQDNRIHLLSQVKLQDLQVFQSRLNKRLSNSSVNRYFNTYKHFFNECERWQVVQASPARLLRSLPENRFTSMRKLWSNSLIEEVGPKLLDRDVELTFYMMAYSGARNVEINRLRWNEDVDLAEGSLIARSRKGDGSLQSRKLYLPTNVIDKLKKHRFTQAYADGFIIGDGFRERCTKSVARAFRRELNGLGVSKDYSFYGLRHSYGTDSIRIDKDLMTTSKVMGHSSVVTTQIYTRIADDQMKEAMKRLHEYRNQTATKTATTSPPEKH